MKAMLTFELPDERHEFELAQKGSAYLSMLEDIRQSIRDKLKYEQHSKETIKVLEELRDLVWDLDL